MISALYMDKTGSMTKYSKFQLQLFSKIYFLDTCIIPHLICNFKTVFFFQVMNMYGDLVMDSVPDKVMNNKITFPAS